MDIISQHGSILWPRNFIRFLQAWVNYVRVEVKLEVYEKWMYVRERFGLSN